MQLQRRANAIVFSIEDKIRKIMAIEYHYNLDYIFKNTLDLCDEDKYGVYEILINYYLKEISKLDSNMVLKEIYKTGEGKSLKKLHEIENIIDFFDCSIFEQNDSSMDLDEKEEEASVIAFDLIAKVLGKNERKLDLPIKIQNIKDFCINSTIKERDMHHLFFFIILDLSVVYNYVNHE